MSWRIRLTDRARKQLLKLDSGPYHQIISALERISRQEDPRAEGKPLVGTLKGVWRYRTGNYRILAKLTDAELLILVVEISDRKDTYR